MQHDAAVAGSCNCPGGSHAYLEPIVWSPRLTTESCCATPLHHTSFLAVPLPGVTPTQPAPPALNGICMVQEEVTFTQARQLSTTAPPSALLTLGTMLRYRTLTQQLDAFLAQVRSGDLSCVWQMCAVHCLLLSLQGRQVEHVAWLQSPSMHACRPHTARLVQRCVMHKLYVTCACCGHTHPCRASKHGWTFPTARLSQRRTGQAARQRTTAQL